MALLFTILGSKIIWIIIALIAIFILGIRIVRPIERGLVERFGKYEAIKIKARAQADAIKLVNESAKKYFVGNAQKLKAYEVTQASLQNNAKILITEKGIQPTIVLGDGVIPISTKK